VCSFTLQSAIVIPGDQKNPSFTFPVGAYTKAGNRGGVTFFTGAGNTAGGDYTIAKLTYMADQFKPMSPETITLDKAKDVTNPFRNKKISLITSISKASGLGYGDFSPLFVANDDKKVLYMIDTVFSSGIVNVISSALVLLDAEENDSAGIISLEGASHGVVFAGVLPESGPFGDIGSGIALFGVSDTLIKDGQEKKGPFLVQQSTAALDEESTFLKIRNNLKSIDENIDLHWDSRINRLFVGLQVEGDSDNNDGARGVAVGRIFRDQKSPPDQQTKIEFNPIAPMDVFSAQNKIVGGVGSDTKVSIHKVRTLHTSNTYDNNAQLGLTYLIVQGSVGSPESTKKRVSALPLVCSGKPEDIGTLAKKDSAIENIVTSQTYPVRVSHCFSEPATTADDVFIVGDIPADVGGGQTIGDIEDICVIGDTVFVSIADASGSKPGVFYSQAILDANNAIINWTPWRRFGGITEKVYGFFTDTFAGQVQYLTGANATINTFKRSQWGSGSDTMSAPLLSALSGFSNEQGRVQGFKDYPQDTPGLSGTNGQVALMITTSKGKVIVGQSGSDASGTFCPTVGSATDKVVSFEGDALDVVGSIVTSEIAVQLANNVRLFVGGVNGLAVLVDGAGGGWNKNDGLGYNFEGFANRSFKVIGDYRFVQKLFTDGDFLYVLTPQKLDRIKLSTSNFATGELDATTVADIRVMPAGSAGCNSALCDVLVSGQCALLATTFGLYRIGNSSDIRMADDATEANWTLVPVLFGVGPALMLQAITATGREQDFASNDGGNVYVLTADTGNNRARISRFTVADVVSSAINDNTIQPLDDVYQNDVKQYFLNPGNLVQRFATDGALTLLGMNRNLNLNPIVYSPHSGVPIDIAQASNIISITKNSASGSHLVATNIGLFTNE